MKRNVNVFIGVVLCAVLCGIFVWLRSAGEEDTWKPNEIYDQVHASTSYSASYTNATFSAPSNDGGLALRMSSSSMMRRSGASFYAGATSSAISLPSLQGGAGGRLIPSLQGGVGGRLTSLQGGTRGTLSSGGGLYTTSSAEIKSFGGGGNGGTSMGGSAMRGASSSTSLTASSPIAYSQSPISLPSLQGGTGGSLQMSAENPMMDVASAASMDNSSFSNPAAGFYNAYTSGSYGSYGNYGGGRSGIRGRQNSGMTDSWLDWLYRYGYRFGNESGSDETGWYYTYTQSQLEAAYNDYITNYWDDMWGSTKPSFEQWLTWMQNGGESGYNYNGNWYMMAPVGDVLPLIFLALLYIAFVAFKSSNPFNSLKSLKSLMSLSTSDRSK